MSDDNLWLPIYFLVVQAYWTAAYLPSLAFLASSRLSSTESLPRRGTTSSGSSFKSKLKIRTEQLTPMAIKCYSQDWPAGWSEKNAPEYWMIKKLTATMMTQMTRKATLSKNPLQMFFSSWIFLEAIMLIIWSQMNRLKMKVMWRLDYPPMF